jgi:hypothetical protein
MTFTEAHTEFSVRLYIWAQSALRTEMSEGFPRFGLCKDGPKSRCHFIQTLDDQSKAVFSRAILQRRHQHAVQALGEVMGAEVEELMRREEAFHSKNNAWARSSDGQKPLGKRMATRRELKKAMNVYFRTTFGSQHLPGLTGGKPEPSFTMMSNGWIIKTEFEFGRWDPEITYAQDIWTGKLITQDEPGVLFANCLGFQLNYGNEIGIGSGWDEITVENLELKCVAVVEHCRKMFEAFPLLLKDLDHQLLTK